MEHLMNFMNSEGLYDSKKQILNHIYNLIESIKKGNTDININNFNLYLIFVISLYLSYDEYFDIPSYYIIRNIFNESFMYKFILKIDLNNLKSVLDEYNEDKKEENFISQNQSKYDFIKGKLVEKGKNFRNFDINHDDKRTIAEYKNYDKIKFHLDEFQEIVELNDDLILKLDDEFNSFNEYLMDSKLIEVSRQIKELPRKADYEHYYNDLLAKAHGAYFDNPVDESKYKEEERIAKEEAERLAREESERLAREESERLAREAERLAREDEAAIKVQALLKGNEERKIVAEKQIINDLYIELSNFLNNRQTTMESIINYLIIKYSEHSKVGQTSIDRFFTSPIERIIEILRELKYTDLQIQYHTEITEEDKEAMFRTDLNELINTLNQLKDSIPYMNKLFIALEQSESFFITNKKSPYLKSTDSRKYITLKEINNRF